MAAKTYLTYFFLITFNFQAFAISDEKHLANWTVSNENKLTKKHQMIQSKWFEESCLSIAKTMKFNKINQCKLFESNNINAYVFNNGHVYFSTSMAALIKNKHQWASILAHENAHIELKHYLKTLKKIKRPGVFFPKSRIKKLIKQHEQDADDWSENKLIEFNFDTSQIFYFFERVKDIQGDSGTSTHLKLSKRIKLNEQQEIIDLDITTSLQQTLGSLSNKFLK